MSETSTIPPYINKTMKFILRSPLHSMVSKTILLITFRGRRSGNTFTTPVSYSQDGDLIYVFTHAGWWKNLGDGAPVTLRIRGRELPGKAESIVDDKEAIASGLAKHLRKVKTDAVYYGVTYDDQDNPRAEEIAKAVQTVVMIQIRLC